jgi:hypothetical protein
LAVCAKSSSANGGCEHRGGDEDRAGQRHLPTCSLSRVVQGDMIERPHSRAGALSVQPRTGKRDLNLTLRLPGSYLPLLY